jgi:hypothetical protein
VTARLLRLLDELESGAEGYLTLEQAERAAGQDLSDLVAQGILLVDYRQRLAADGGVEPLSVCRLNRHHPQVKDLSSWR